MSAKRNLNKVPPDHRRAKYSGPTSEQFWRRLNRLKNQGARTMCYELACALQDIEYRLLRAMETAEKMGRK